MSKASPTRCSSATSDLVSGAPSTPCARPAQHLRAHRGSKLPVAFRNMVIIGDPFIGPPLNGGISELERRLRLVTPRCVARKGSTHRMRAPRIGDAFTAPPRLHNRTTPDTGKLRSRIKQLERVKSKLQEKLQDQREALKDARMEAESAQMELDKADDAASSLKKAEESVRNLRVSVASLKHDGNKYRRWWLTEYHSLQVALSLIPNREDVEAISASAHARFAAYSK